MEKRKKAKPRIDEDKLLDRLVLLTVALIGSYYLFLWASTFKHLGWPPQQNQEQQWNSSNGQPYPHQSPSFSGQSYTKSDKTECDKTNQSDCYIPQPARERRDLYAQEGMWRASVFVAIFTGISIFIGAFGLALLYFTLRETQRTLDEAKDATSATREASLVSIQRDSPLIDIVFGVKFDARTPSVLKVTAGLQNIGSTAALDISVTAFFMKRIDGVFTVNGGRGKPTFYWPTLLPKKDLSAERRDLPYVFCPVIDEEMPTSEILDIPNSRLYFFCTVHYSTVFDTQTKPRWFAYRIRPLMVEALHIEALAKMMRLDNMPAEATVAQLDTAIEEANKPENIKGVTWYRCGESVYKQAIEVNTGWETRLASGMGFGMPNILQPDDDE